MTWWKNRSIRFRLTLSYSALFVFGAVILLAINFALLTSRLDRGTQDLRPGARRPPSLVVSRERQLRDQVRDEARESTLVVSGIALGVATLVSFGTGWIVSGRMLRPVHEITDAARDLSEHNLDRRIALAGPDDELKELADTFDSMLARLDHAFEGQKEFVANASHELRTPLTLIRTEVDVALDNPDLDRAEFDDTLVAVRRAVERSQALIGRLLVLARAEGGIGDDSVDLATATQAVLDDLDAKASERGLELRSELVPAQIEGDATLIERLVANLVENTIRYNVDGGWIRVETGPVDDGRGGRGAGSTGAGGVSAGSRGGFVSVVNSGPVVSPEEVDDLFERFKRREKSRDRRTGGFGLGLAIVKSVATVHGATIDAQAPPEGGLSVRVTFPAA